MKSIVFNWYTRLFALLGLALAMSFFAIKTRDGRMDGSQSWAVPMRVGSMNVIGAGVSTASRQAVCDSLEVTHRLLVQKAANEEFSELLRQIYGNTGTPPELFEKRLTELRSDLMAGKGFALDFDVRKQEEMAGLFAAYASDSHSHTERIYINNQWAERSSADALETVILEELGHAIDRRLNDQTDTCGDEGKAFAHALTQRMLTPQIAMARSSTPSDHRVLSIDGMPIAVEAATPPSTWTPQSTQSDYFFSSYTGTNPAHGQATSDLPGNAGTEQSYASDVYENLLFSNTSNGGPRNFDIKQVDLTYNDDFIIFKMTVNGIINKGYYYYELEVDKATDVRPDFWVQYLHEEDGTLSQTAWTNNQSRFSLYRDANNDVGGSSITTSNISSGTKGDGYDTNVSLSSQDTWFRVNGGQLEIAISRSKLSLTAALASAGVRAWSSHGDQARENLTFRNPCKLKDCRFFVRLGRGLRLSIPLA